MIDFSNTDLSGRRVRMMNGDVCIVDRRTHYVSRRGEGYDSRCLSHLFDLSGSSMIRDKYTIVKVLADSELVARREYEGDHPISGMPFDGRWVVRDEDGNFVDRDQYRNDLKDRYEGLEIIGD